MVIYVHSHRFIELAINRDSFIFTLYLVSKPDYPSIDIFIDITENYNWDRILQNFNREKFVPPRPCFSFWFMNHNQCRRTFKFRKGLSDFKFEFLFLLITCLFKILKLAQMRIQNDQTTHTIVAAVDLVFLLAAKFSCKQKYVITIQFDLLYYFTRSKCILMSHHNRFGLGEKYTMRLEILPYVLR